MGLVRWQEASLEIRDGVAESVTVKMGDGNLTWTATREMIYVKDRGQLDEVREGEQQPVELEMSSRWEYLTGPSAASTTTTGLPTPYDCFTQSGAAADWVSSDANTCNPYAVDMVFEFDPATSSCGDYETITFSDFRWESISADVSAGQITVSGKCNITLPTGVRTVNS